MFLFAYLRGQKKGIMGPIGQKGLITKAINALTHSTDKEGRVLGVSEGTWPGTVEYYKSLSTGEWWWGTGAFLLAMVELASE